MNREEAVKEMRIRLEQNQNPLSAMIFLYDALAANAKPGALVCERCDVIGVEGTPGWKDVSREGMTAWLCPDCAKPEPVEKHVIGESGLTISSGNPKPETDAATGYEEAKNASDKSFHKGKSEFWKAEREAAASVIVERTFERDGWIYRHRVVSEQRDSLRAELASALSEEQARSLRRDCRRNELRVEEAEARLGSYIAEANEWNLEARQQTDRAEAAVKAAVKFKEWALCSRHADPDNSGQCIKCGMPEDAGVDPCDEPMPPGFSLPDAVVEARRAMSMWYMDAHPDERCPQALIAERIASDSALREALEEIERLKRLMRLRGSVPLKAHQFEGPIPSDRDCEICGRPDRDPIHKEATDPTKTTRRGD